MVYVVLNVSIYPLKDFKQAFGKRILCLGYLYVASETKKIYHLYFPTPSKFVIKKQKANMKYFCLSYDSYNLNAEFMVRFDILSYLIYIIPMN